MANEEEPTSNFHSGTFLTESANEGASLSLSLESTSAESESAATEIEVKVKGNLENTRNQTQTHEVKPNFQDAKEIEIKQANICSDVGIADQSVSTSTSTLVTTTTMSTSDTTITTTTSATASAAAANKNENENNSSSLVQVDSFTAKQGESEIQKIEKMTFVENEEKITLGESSSKTSTSTTSKSFDGDEVDEEREEIEEYEKDFEDRSYDEDTISSEAVVDDIELILMPETVQDLPTADLSPQLVRVTELKRSIDYDGNVFRDEDEEDDATDQESDFRKMGSEDEDQEEGREGDRDQTFRKTFLSRSSAGDGGDEEGEDLSDSRNYERIKDRKSSERVNSGVQTDITALESSDTTTSIPFEFRRKSSGKSSSRLLGVGGVPGKRLNWKSELTLLPSKTKISTTGFSGYESMNYQDQYSPRVTKFTSQDTLNSSSQFLRPSTLYRTRNLSRNLNQCTSESTLEMPDVGLPLSTDSPRYRDRVGSSTSSNFRGTVSLQSYAKYHASAAIALTRRQPQPPLPAGIRNFRSSLPDLSASKGSSDNKGRRQSFRSIKQKSSSGNRLQKKSSNSDDDETSSLIDESERCLRSSIDLLLTDDLPSPGADFSCRSTGFGGGFTKSASYGYYSSRRSHSQPLLTDDGDYGDLRDATMGSPFLPRKLSDMRCSRFAKVILPNGHVAVVQVKEMDELRGNLTVQTDTGCIFCLPFRKVVFAWKTKR